MRILALACAALCVSLRTQFKFSELRFSSFFNEHNNTGLTGLVQGLNMITCSHVVRIPLMLVKSESKWC